MSTSREAPPSGVTDVHILWITAGLGCDGDTVSVTAAEQPAIEDVLLGGIPGIPKVHLYNPVLAPEVGDDFMSYFYKAEAGDLEPFVLVVEGSIPNEEVKPEGYWAESGRRRWGNGSSISGKRPSTCSTTTSSTTTWSGSTTANRW